MDISYDTWASLRALGQGPERSRSGTPRLGSRHRRDLQILQKRELISPRRTQFNMPKIQVMPATQIQLES